MGRYEFITERVRRMGPSADDREHREKRSRRKGAYRLLDLYRDCYL